MSAAEIEKKLEAYRVSLTEVAATAQRQKAAAAAAAERSISPACLTARTRASLRLAADWALRQPVRPSSCLTHVPALQSAGEVSGPGHCRGDKETHWLAEQKQQELARVREAWGIQDTVEGEAFNRDIQEAKKAGPHPAAREGQAGQGRSGVREGG